MYHKVIPVILLPGNIGMQPIDSSLVGAGNGWERTSMLCFLPVQSPKLEMHSLLLATGEYTGFKFPVYVAKQVL